MNTYALYFFVIRKIISDLKKSTFKKCYNTGVCLPVYRNNIKHD